MGRTPCCSKEEMNRGAWTAIEDKSLTDYIKRHGEGKWRTLPKKAGLMRCGKSCRLRWLNYLRPDIKRGNITEDEEELIIRLHKLLGNRWSLIARRIPGRTDNEVKNYWNTKIGKKQSQKKQSPNSSNSKLDLSSVHKSKLVWTKVSRCNKVVLPHEQLVNPHQHTKSAVAPPPDNVATNSTQDNAMCQEPLHHFGREDLTAEFEMDEQFFSNLFNIDFSDVIKHVDDPDNFFPNPNQFADDVLISDDTLKSSSYFPLVPNYEMDPSDELGWFHG